MTALGLQLDRPVGHLNPHTNPQRRAHGSESLFRTLFDVKKARFVSLTRVARPVGLRPYVIILRGLVVFLRSGLVSAVVSSKCARAEAEPQSQI